MPGAAACSSWAAAADGRTAQLWAARTAVSAAPKAGSKTDSRADGGGRGRPGTRREEHTGAGNLAQWRTGHGGNAACAHSRRF